MIIGSVARRSAYFDEGFGPVQYTSVQCNGTETRIQDCPYTIENSCTHSADAGVTCVGEYNSLVEFESSPTEMSVPMLLCHLGIPCLVP